MKRVNRIVFGLWPISGMNTVGVTRRDAEATVVAAIESGIDTFDTAFSYGISGASASYLYPHLKQARDQFCVIAKVGQRYLSNQRRVIDGSPKTLCDDTETLLTNLGIERADYLLLHCPDPNVELQSSADAIAKLQRRGLATKTGVCNVSIEQLRLFERSADCNAIQCPLNLMQRGTLDNIITEAAGSNCEVFAYWVLMKGLLAGKISREHQFHPDDDRPNYDIFQGSIRRRAHLILDQLARLANELHVSIPELTIGWALSQPGVTGALVGGRSPAQIRENARAIPLTDDVIAAINEIVAEVEGANN